MFPKNVATFMETSVSVRNGLLHAAYVMKETACRIPLAVDSAHPMHVHSTWPVAMMKRVARISHSHKQATLIQCEMQDRLRNARSGHDDVIRKLQEKRVREEPAPAL